MGFDPFGVNRHHESIRLKILAREPGYAQSVIGDVLVSYEAAASQNAAFVFSPMVSGLTLRQSQLLDEMILDVARAEGIASPKTFSRARIVRMVDDFSSYPPDHIKMLRRAELLHHFFLLAGSRGSVFLY